MWFKIYIFSLIIVSLAVISFNIFAQVEESKYSLKEYLKGKNCPSFIDINELTMKDECTGVTWARHDLPVYDQIGDTQIGYNWQEANDACSSLEPAGLFRLPTVEELVSLISYQCSGTNCQAAMNNDLDKNGSADFEYTTFAAGNYWSANDFNEPERWLLPPNNPQRDYKRSVNLLNGEVDTPVFNKNFRLNAWCVIDRNPEILEKKFTAASTVAIAHGREITGGSLKTVYNRKCTFTNPDDCTALNETSCDNGFCAKIKNITLSRVAYCDPGYHIRGNSCAINPVSTVVCGNGVIEATELCDDGGQNGAVGYCNSLCSGLHLLGIPLFSDTFEDSEFSDNRWWNNYCPTGTTPCSWTYEIVNNSHWLKGIAGNGGAFEPRLRMPVIPDFGNVTIATMVDFDISPNDDVLIVARENQLPAGEESYALWNNWGAAPASIAIRRQKNNVWTASPLVSAPAITSGRYWIMFKLNNDANNNIVLQARWWRVGTVMPNNTWNMEITDAHEDRITTGGHVGVGSWINTTIYFDNFQVYSNL